jgi:hypothetical protein
MDGARELKIMCPGCETRSAYPSREFGGDSVLCLCRNCPTITMILCTPDTVARIAALNGLKVPEDV